MTPTLIFSNYKLDLSNYNLSITEDNFWFSDRFLAKYVLPINVVITDELNQALGDILSYTSEDAETYVPCKIYLHGKEKEAILEIEELEGRDATVNIRYGIEELPNANKKLKELPLEYLDLDSTSIYDHAETIITQSYPDVNYNFVMVHVDKFETDEDQWIHFQKILNKRVSGDFVENEYDSIEDEQVNRNIMQPQPYLLHVLKKGFEDIGLTLQGDILNDAHIKKAICSEISDYYSTVTTESQELSFNQTEWETEVLRNVNAFTGQGYHYGNFEHEITLPEHGRYKIAGNLNLRKKSGQWGYVKIEFNGNKIYEKVKTFFASGQWFYQVNKNIDFNSGSGIVKITSFQRSRFVDSSSPDYEDYGIADLTITQLAKFDGSGNPVATLLAPTEIKLTECVPDMTFGELITTVKNLKLFDLDINQNTVTMNYIINQIVPNNPVDLSSFEIENPIRIFNKGNSFELKFKLDNTEEYVYEKIFVTESGYLSNNYTRNDDTQEIAINAMPLPVISRDEIQTAHHFTDDKSTLKLILYDGAVAVTNAAEPIDGLLIDQLYENHYEAWLNIRIFGKGLKWNFRCTEEKLSEFNIKSVVFCYRRNHIIKRLNKDQIARGYWNVEAEILAIPD